MNVLILYSWQDDTNKPSEWAMAFCNELEKYENLHATCDKLWYPQSNIDATIKEKINSADKLIVIVTQKYNEKVQKGDGVVSIEEKIYSEVVSCCSSNNKILFILKESNVSLPKGYSNYARYDMSDFNKLNYPFLSKKEIENHFDNIVRILFDIPEYTVRTHHRKKIPSSKKVKSFNDLFIVKEPESQLDINEQEKNLLDFLQKNCNQETMVYDYLRCGLAVDLNFHGRITPELFKKHFLVERNYEEEAQFNRIIRDVFSSPNHNMLCFQSDGGSGKSVFIRTMSQRLDENHRTTYKYNNTIFDLANLHENVLTKDALVFQRLKKEYRHMVRSYKDNQAYAVQWLKAFSETIRSLNQVSFCDDVHLFKLHKFQEELSKAINAIVPENADVNVENLETWYNGFSERINNAKTIIDESNILFIILLTILLIILKCKPSGQNQERYIFTFDNIETYDNGEFTRSIASYIQKCHSYIRTIFGEIGELDCFYSKFTFVFVIRTSTRANFGNLQIDLWGGGKYVKTIKFFDFSVEALLKKIKFISKLKDYKNTLLYKELYLIASILVPTSVINQWLDNNPENIVMYKHFTSRRLLPLFNNNYRKTIMYICNALYADESHYAILERLESLKNKYDTLYDYSINGIRMIIIRSIFDTFQEHEYLSTMGFSKLSGDEDHSITRTILSYLYWDEYKHVVSEASSKYIGMSLFSIINQLRDYCNSSQFADIMYGLSMYAYKNHLKKEALEAWGYLLTYANLNIDLSESEFKDIITQCYLNKKKTIIIQEAEIHLDQIFVKLSDAGMCFTQYYIRNFEFLMSRSQHKHETPPLFMLKSYDEIKSCIDRLHHIIENCIEKLISHCKEVCVLYGHQKDQCVKKSKKKLSFLSCSLFIRYQESVDLIRESIDYIDRFRIVYFYNHHDERLNNMLLQQLKEFYNLYAYLNKMVTGSDDQNRIYDFLPNLSCPSIVSANRTISTDLSSKDKSTRIDRIRPTQSYYVHYNEKINTAIEKAKKEPLQTIYSIIEKDSLS